MQKYVEKLKPNVADIWGGDELWIKVKHDMNYLFVSMDDETRYLIGQEAADTNMRHAIYSAKAKKLFLKRERL
jgi:hypothetical protein